MEDEGGRGSVELVESIIYLILNITVWTSRWQCAM